MSKWDQKLTGSGRLQTLHISGARRHAKRNHMKSPPAHSQVNGPPRLGLGFAASAAHCLSRHAFRREAAGALVLKDAQGFWVLRLLLRGAFVEL